MRWMILVLMIGLLACSDHTAHDIRIIDGDTLELDGETIRLAGIDAPESNQTCLDPFGAAYACGRTATAELERHAAHGVTCDDRGPDVYGRRLAVCWDARSQSINAALVRDGWALADYEIWYADEQMQAATEGRGMWQGDFIRPRDWRRGHRWEGE